MKIHTRTFLLLPLLLVLARAAVAAPTAMAAPTGAGDVFATAFFIALEAGEEPVVAARRACAAASCVIEGMGVETLPTLGAVEARMART